MAYLKDSILWMLALGGISAVAVFFPDTKKATWDPEVLDLSKPFFADEFFNLSPDEQELWREQNPPKTAPPPKPSPPSSNKKMAANHQAVAKIREAEAKRLQAELELKKLEAAELAAQRAESARIRKDRADKAAFERLKREEMDREWEREREAVAKRESEKATEEARKQQREARFKAMQRRAIYLKRQRMRARTRANIKAHHSASLRGMAAQQRQHMMNSYGRAR